jgi:hypothetical protein
MKAKSVKIYFRDQSGVMRAIPHVKAVKRGDDLAGLYTLYPLPRQEIDLE